MVAFTIGKYTPSSTALFAKLTWSMITDVDVH